MDKAKLSEAVRAGMARARAEGKTLGRPRKVDACGKLVYELWVKGLTIREIAERTGVSRSTVQRAIQQQLRK